VVNHWKSMQPAEYDQEVGRMLDAETRKAENPDEDPLFKQALASRRRTAGSRPASCRGSCASDITAPRA
jgi:hypothetical protein